MANRLQEILQKPITYYILLGSLLAFLTINVNPTLGAPFGIMLLVDFIIFQLSPTKIKQNQFPNTPKAFASALIAFGILFAVSIALTFVLQSTALLQGESLVQSVMRHGFTATGLEQATLGQAEPIFAGSKIATYVTFAFVIAYIETRFIIRLLFAFADLFKVSTRKFGYTLGLIYIVVASGFVWFHANVKGVEDNVALIITFFSQ